MNPRRPTIQGLLGLVAAILGVALIVTPLTDVIMFGIHDHIAAAQAESTLETVGDAQGSHHCDVWMSPADIALAVDLPATSPAVFLARGPALFPVPAEPLPSFPPPRA